jgi:competence protein ComEA
LPFVESSQSLTSKLHLSDVSRPVIVGIVALFVAACLMAVQNATYVLGGADASVGNDDAMVVTSGDGADQADGEASAAGQDASSGADGAAQATASSSSGKADAVVVFVSGNVREPGVYSLEAGSRVQDALDAAGGFSEGAAPDAVNLARVVQDGEQIDIISQEEADEGVAPRAEGAASNPSAASIQGGALVNINTADASELQTLPGVGEVTARKIIESREQEGPFATPDDVKRVSGIGEKKYAALSDLITVG